MSDLKISKKSWSSEEDSLLLRLVTEYGLNGHWSTISSKMGNRTGKQCRERYHNHLKPDIWKGTWSQEEDNLLNESQRTMGNQWAKIAKLLPGRSDNSVKNRWHIINRKKNNASEELTAVSTSSVPPKASRPVVPKLSLSNLVKTATVAQVRADTELDLMSFYYSHGSHSHRRNATDSTRTNASTEAESCPGSGRRDYSATESAPVDVFEEDFDFEDDDTMASFIDNTCDANSFNNTLSSCMSELTTNTSEFKARDDGFDMDSWEDSIANVTNSHSGDENDKLELNIDRFSEPALSFRDMDSVLDDLAHCDEDADEEYRREQFSEEDDLFFLNDLMDECTNMNTAANASPLIVRSTDKKSQLNMFVTMLQQQYSNQQVQQLDKSSSSNRISSFSPRTTPRSPLCSQQQQKRRRAGRTPRSPYQMLLQVL